MNDPYEILGVSRDATDDEIKNAYREKARKYQNDRYADGPLSEIASKKMQELDDAYDEIIAANRSGSSYNSSTTYNASSAYNTYTAGGSSKTSPTYAKIRELIRKNDLDNAQLMLNDIHEIDRIAEWYYLQGMIQQKKGWTNAAYENYERASQMDPMNPEYARAYQSFNYNRSGGYRVDTGRRNSDSDCDFCKVCQGLICADCCCECMGGDLIPCC